MAKSLKISCAFNFVSRNSKFWEIRFPVYTFQTKKTAYIYLYPFSYVQKFCFCFLIKNIYICLYLSWIFLILHPLMTKVSIPFCQWKWWMSPKFWIFQISVNINISIFRVLPISPKISTFRGKLRCFQITLKIRFFFAHISENINISSKRTQFWDNLKISFLFTSRKISIFWGK